MSDEGRRKGLGRGLSALLEEEPEDRVTMDRLRSGRTVPIQQLSPNPYQPRRHFDEDELNDLAESIRVNGIIMPILVRRAEGDDDAYEIVAGERRWRAAQLAQLHEVPVVVKELSDAQSLELALIENIQRQDLNALEEAEGYRRLMDEFSHTQEALAHTVGKSRSHVANMMRLLNLPEAVKAMMRQGQLSAGHGRALLGADEPEKLAKKIAKKGLSVREAERLVQKQGAGEPARGGGGETDATHKDANTRALEKQLSEKLGLKVTILHHGEKGEVRIAYSSLEQFDDILARLRHTPMGGMHD
jgi:ParB family chromosome partitioning protein